MSLFMNLAVARKAFSVKESRMMNLSGNTRRHSGKMAGTSDILLFTLGTISSTNKPYTELAGINDLFSP